MKVSTRAGFLSRGQIHYTLRLPVFTTFAKGREKKVYGGGPEELSSWDPMKGERKACWGSLRNGIPVAARQVLMEKKRRGIGFINENIALKILKEGGE